MLPAFQALCACLGPLGHNPLPQDILLCLAFIAPPLEQYLDGLGGPGVGTQLDGTMTSETIGIVICAEP